MADKKDDIVLSIRGMSKSFGRNRVLDHINLDVKRGTVMGLMGENGAGKSTMMKCLFGTYQKDEGNIFLKGKEVSFSGPKDALENGIAMVHQELNQCLERNVIDNLFLGRYPVNSMGIVDEGRMKKEASELFRKLGMTVDLTQPMRNMSVSQRQMCEIAKAISYNSQVIVLDEPTSSLTVQEVDKLFEMMRMLKEQGIALIYISHKMDEVFRIADDITVFRDGTVVKSMRAEDTNIDEVIALMVGRRMENVYPKENIEIGEPLLEVKDLKSGQLFEDVTFHVGKGEIVGFAGLVGAGRTEVMRCLFGLDPIDGGTVTVHGKEIKIKRVADATKAGMVMLSEDRRRYGIIPMRSVRENASLAALEKFFYGGRSHRKEEEAMVAKYFDKMSVKTPTQETPIQSLSGGNQQKVLLAKWMMRDPEVLILDEPTRGIDVGAKFEIYKLMTEVAQAGKAVVMVSSELPELIGMCDRIYVMNQGHIAGELKREEFSQEAIMVYATGTHSIIQE